MISSATLDGMEPVKFYQIKSDKNISKNNLKNCNKKLVLLLSLAFANGMLGLSCYLFPDIFLDEIHWVFAATFILSFLIILFFRKNLIYQLRLAFLIAIGYWAGFVKSIDVNALFSPVGILEQTAEIGLKMLGLTSFALLGATIGFMMSGVELSLSPKKYSEMSLKVNTAHKLFILNSFVVALVGYLSAISYGPIVFEASYASGGKGQLLGNLQSIGVVSLVICTITSIAIKSRKFICMTIILGLYFLVWGILIRGGRLEFISGIVALYVCIPMFYGNVANIKPSMYMPIVLAVALLEIWGSVRGVLADGGLTMDFIVNNYKNLSDSGVYFAGTVSGIATTFSNILHMFDADVVNFQYGKTYAEYILRTPPEFIYPSRPTDPAWMFESYGYDAIGGFFELTEAYYNFGLIGCLLVPLIISFVIGKIYRGALNGHLLWLYLFIALISVLPRGAWYQTFAFYKSIFTGLVMYLITSVLIRIKFK